MLATKRFGPTRKAPSHEEERTEEGGRKFKPQAVGAVQVLGLGPSSDQMKLKPVKGDEGGSKAAAVSSRQRPVPPAQRSPLPNPSEQLDQASSGRKSPQVRPKPDHRLRRGTPDHRPPHDNRDHLSSDHADSATGHKSPTPLSHPHKDSSPPPSPITTPQSKRTAKNRFPSYHAYKKSLRATLIVRSPFQAFK